MWELVPIELVHPRHLLGLTVSEAALVLGRTPNAVWALERRALDWLGSISESPARQRRPLQPQRLGVRMRSRESPVAYRRRWALSLL